MLHLKSEYVTILDFQMLHVTLFGKKCYTFFHVAGGCTAPPKTMFSDACLGGNTVIAAPQRGAAYQLHAKYTGQPTSRVTESMPSWP